MTMRHVHQPLAASRYFQVAVVLALVIIVRAQPPNDDPSSAIEQHITARDLHLAERPNDPGLLADQAADYYFEYLSIDAAGWTTILGVPSASQRERARRAGKRIYEFARRAEAAIEDRIHDIEVTPGYTDNLDLQRERRRLVDEERDRRIPFLIGVGASVRAHADGVTNEERDALFATTLDTLSALGRRLTGPLAAHAYVHAGIAAAESGRIDDARKLLDEAEAQPEVEPLVLFATRLVSATLDVQQAQRNLDRLASQPAYSRSMFHRLLIADRVFLAQKSRSMKEAINAYIALLDAPLEVSREVSRDIVLARLADATADVPAADRPPFAMIAHVEGTLREAQPSRDAIDTMNRLLRRADLSAMEKAHALLTQARLHHREGDHLKAADSYIRLAREHSGRPEAERAIETGLAIALERYRSEPAVTRDILHHGLEVALQTYSRSATIDRWRFVAARLAMNEARYDDAIDMAAAINPSHELAIEGALLRIAAIRSAATWRDDSDRRRALFNDLILSAESLSPRLKREIDQASVERAAALEQFSHELRIHLAAAYVGLDEAERGLALLDGFEVEARVDGPLLAEALRVRIEALQALDRSRDAQEQIERFIEYGTPSQIRSVLGSLLTSIEHRVTDSQSRDRTAQAEALAVAELAPLAARLDSWMSEDESRFDAALALAIAEAHRSAGKFDRGLLLYDRLLQSHPNALPLLLGRAECLYHLGIETNNESQLGEAMTIYRRLVSAGAEMHDVYWKSQLRALQILDATKRNTHQIGPQIQRLRLRDPGLGGERFLAEFERLQNKYSH